MKDVDRSVLIHFSISFRGYGFKLDQICSVCIGEYNWKCVLFTWIEDRRSIDDIKIIIREMDDGDSNCITIAMRFKAYRTQLWVILILDEPKYVRVQIVLLPHVCGYFRFYNAQAAAEHKQYNENKRGCFFHLTFFTSQIYSLNLGVEYGCKDCMMMIYFQRIVKRVVVFVLSCFRRIYKERPLEERSFGYTIRCFGTSGSIRCNRAEQ